MNLHHVRFLLYFLFLFCLPRRYPTQVLTSFVSLHFHLVLGHLPDCLPSPMGPYELTAVLTLSFFRVLLGPCWAFIVYAIFRSFIWQRLCLLVACSWLAHLYSHVPGVVYPPWINAFVHLPDVLCPQRRPRLAPCFVSARAGPPDLR